MTCKLISLIGLLFIAEPSYSYSKTIPLSKHGVFFFFTCLICSSEENGESSEAMVASDGGSRSKFRVTKSDNMLGLHECSSLGTDIFESSDDICLDRRKGHPRTHEWLLRGSVKVSAEVARQKACALPRGNVGKNRTNNARLNSMLADCDEVTIPDAVTPTEEEEDMIKSQQETRSTSMDGGIEFSAPPRASPSAHRPPPRLVIPQEPVDSGSRTPSPKTFRVTSTSPRQRSVSQPPEYGSVKAGQESDIWIPVFDMQATGLYSPQMPRRSYLERSQWFDNSEVNNNSTARYPAPEQEARTSQSSEEVGFTTIKTTVTPTHIEWSLSSDSGKLRSNSELSSPPSSAWFTPPSTPDTPRSMDATDVKDTPPQESGESCSGNPTRTALAMTRTSWDASADDEEWVKRWEFLTSDEDGEFWGQETLV